MVVRKALSEVENHPGGAGWGDRMKFQTLSINNLSSTPLAIFLLTSTF